MLHIDPYVSKLIVEAAQNNMQEKESMSDNHTSHFNAEKRTVMICDDDEDLLNLFGQALKPKYNTILVSSGEDCIDKFIKENNKGNKIHLILLDYKLGDMLGDSVARKIKEYNGVKIILISAYDPDDSLIKELQENNYISKCIEKPVHLSNLMETIANTIS
jgi:response regulator RpfG family c-di-GMP phosphodiesterase